MIFKSIKIKEVLEEVIDNRGKTPPKIDDGIELIETTSIVGQNKFPNYNKISKFVSKETYDNWFRSGHPKKGDILIATVGANIGNVAIMKRDRGCIAQNLVALRVDDNYCTNEYLYYYLSSYKVQYRLKNLDIGSAQPNLKVPHLLNMEIKLPPINTQNKITNLLSVFDSKMENNKKMNKTLEEMAQAIYKSWFRDFEPFQDEEFVKSELGMIPKGWKVIKLKEIVSLKNGKRPNEKNENPQKNFKVPVIGASGVMAYTEESLYDEPILVVGRVGTLGVVQRYNSHCWTSDNTIVIKSDFYEYVYQILKTINFKSLNRGSTQPLIAQKDIKSQKVVFPPKNILKEFSDIVSKLFEKVKNNKRENQTLKKLRDSLLPKLMSGEIRVPLEKGKKEVN